MNCLGYLSVRSPCLPGNLRRNILYSGTLYVCDFDFDVDPKEGHRFDIRGNKVWGGSSSRGH